jgi:hypothetical protein
LAEKTWQVDVVYLIDGERNYHVDISCHLDDGDCCSVLKRLNRMKKEKLFTVLNFRELPMRTCFSLLAVGVVATALSTSAQISIGPGSIPSQIFYTNTISQNPYAPDIPAWVLGNSCDPISIIYDSLAGVWQGQFSGGGSFQQFQEVPLLDYIKVGDNSQWADWHETISTPNFIWSIDAGSTFFTINGGAPQYTGISFSPDQSTLNIAFQMNLPMGAEIVLFQVVEYVGVASFDNNTTSLVLNQFQLVAIPEPSSVAVFGLGAVLALIPRWRKQLSRRA